VSRRAHRDEVVGDVLPGAVLDGEEFVRCDFDGADLAEIVTRGCRFDACRFTNADLSGSRHERSAFTNCDLRRAVLSTAVFAGCKMTGSELIGARLVGVTIDGGDWSWVNWRQQSLVGLDLRGVLLVEADLSAADLTDAVLVPSRWPSCGAPSSTPRADGGPARLPPQPATAVARDRRCRSR